MWIWHAHYLNFGSTKNYVQYPFFQLIDSESPPYFVNSSRTVVYTTLSSTVTLVCRVRNLGDRSVSHFLQSTFLKKDSFVLKTKKRKKKLSVFNRFSYKKDRYSFFGNFKTSGSFSETIVFFLNEMIGFRKEKTKQKTIVI